MKIPFNICLCLSPTGLPRVLWHSTLTSPKKVWRGSSHNWPRETLMKLLFGHKLCPLTTHGPYITLLRQPTENYILWVDYPYGHCRSQSRTCKQNFSSKKIKNRGVQLIWTFCQQTTLVQYDTTDIEDLLSTSTSPFWWSMHLHLS